MKTNLNLKNMSKSLNNFISEYHLFIDTYNTVLLEEIIRSNEELLKSISEEYNLDYEELEIKYLRDNIKKSKNKNLIDIDDNDSDIDLSNAIQKNEPVLERKEINGIVCFVDNKKGCIYNKEVIKIGQVENGEYKLFIK